MISKSGIMFRLDPDFHEFLIEIQSERLKLRVDKKNEKRSLTQISRICWKILKNNKNLKKLLLQKLPLC